ncbi:stage II sporulation protein P [Ruminiclostridium josui]|uniref:stage II sporulation protein P n=1 Tax=Ruminiclostridium josui TaxID=1499 RepID=UPI000463CC2F|nr:stage II sporulation protein P [Ruminiclostridium josui]
MRDTIYDNTYLEGNKGNLTKLPIILCAVGGIVLGGLAFSLANGKVKIPIDLKQISSGNVTTIQSSESIKEYVFKLFGIDIYNPITILNTNYPYFKMFYDEKYQPPASEKVQQEIKKIQNAQTESIQPQENLAQKPSDTSTVQFKEASSSITFEGDVEETDQNNNPIVSSGKINIKNETSLKIDIKKLLNEPLKLAPDKKGPKILIYHTHTTECFLKSADEIGKSNTPSRTTNNKYNVVRVGEALINNLKKYNIDVLHNTTIHDADYNSSYIKSLNTLTGYVEKYSSLKMVIDLHRDAASEGKLRAVQNINGKNVAEIMFVIGTDAKLNNPRWKENLKLAIKVQARLNEICPGIAKPIYVSKNRYNQHLLNGSVIVEIGGDGNVIDECVRSTSYLAQAINDVIFKKK